MGYLIAAYAITFGVLGLYGAALIREKTRYRAQHAPLSESRSTKS